MRNGQIDNSIKTYNEIVDLLKDDIKKQDFLRPITAFVTFHSQEGYERCVQKFATEK